MKNVKRRDHLYIDLCFNTYNNMLYMRIKKIDFFELLFVITYKLLVNHNEIRI